MSGEGFLSRWSARKRAAEGRDVTSQTAETAPETAAPGAPDPEAAPERSDADLLAAHGLADPDTLGPGADFGAYLRAGLPAHLKRRALRRLWTSNPVLANLDGLNDYDEDYRAAAAAGGALRTAYRVGRGLLDRAVETPGRAAHAPEPTDPAAPPLEPEPPETALEAPAPAAEPAPVASSRRMAFRFEDDPEA